MLFGELKFVFEVYEKEYIGDIIGDLYTYLASLLKKTQLHRIMEREQNTDRTTGTQNTVYTQTIAVRTANYQCVIKEEMLLQLCTFLKFKEANIHL